jgi:tRNA (cmo5U34)-methyltransferase
VHDIAALGCGDVIGEVAGYVDGVCGEHHVHRFGAGTEILAKAALAGSDSWALGAVSGGWIWAMSSNTMPLEIAEYRKMQRSIPGVDGLYAASCAIIETCVPDGGNVLIVGAGGGRELELLSASKKSLVFTAVEKSESSLDRTRAFTDALGLNERIKFVCGEIDAAPLKPLNDGATSLLVMHFLPDDGTKLRYLQAIRTRLREGAPFIIADVSFEDKATFDRTVPLFLTHASNSGVEPDHAAVDPRVIPSMPIINDRRTCALLVDAGFSEVTPFFRGFWYAGWWARAV